MNEMTREETEILVAAAAVGFFTSGFGAAVGFAKHPLLGPIGAILGFVVGAVAVGEALRIDDVEGSDRTDNVIDFVHKHR